MCEHVFWHGDTEILRACYLMRCRMAQIWHLFWHSTWHSFWHVFWYSFWHVLWYSFWYSFWHVFWCSFWCSSDILSGMYADILFLTFFSGIYSGIQLRSGIYSGTLRQFSDVPLPVKHTGRKELMWFQVKTASFNGDVCILRRLLAEHKDGSP